ncbi:MAG: hypothetical protein AMXMBFR13_03360 [Phycisphaerae bacterium]
MARETYLDKCRGAWAGQMIGVAYGGPYEFTVTGRIQDEPIRPWKPEHIRGALCQDDLYVESIWLDALDRYGLDITPAQAGQAFADTDCGLEHANNAGRENVRRGILPPMSGHPDHNRHADDIDFQIESDLFGIICPGLPRESNRLCDTFGHIMNYGDGVYGGMFVAGMYAAAYFESSDVETVVRGGLACLPADSRYARMVRDVIGWYHQHPEDWRATWHAVEKRWQDDEDCVPGSPFNIDATINGAYVVLSLLHGQGDLAKTLEIGVRCGQDSDCNPATAAGVLGCMKGLKSLPAEYTADLAAIGAQPFCGSYHSFEQAVEASRILAEKMIVRAGGQVGSAGSAESAGQIPAGGAGSSDDVWLIPVQQPSPARLEQWENQRPALAIAIPQTEVDSWDPRWRVLSCGHEMGPGYKPDFAGVEHVLLLVPRRDGPAVMEGELEVPPDAKVMRIPVSSFGSDGHWVGDFRLKVLIGGDPGADEVIRTFGRFQSRTVDVTRYAGRKVMVRIEVHQENDYHWERAYFGRVTFE